MELKRFFNTEAGRVNISILLGLGMATLFRKKCHGDDCLTFKGPSLEDIKTKKYKYGDKCFQYEINSIMCDDKKNIVEFA